MFQAHFHEFADVLVRKGVVHYAALPLGLDQIQRSQKSELVGDSGHVHSQDRREIAHTDVSLRYAVEDLQTARVAQYLEDAGNSLNRAGLRKRTSERPNLAGVNTGNLARLAFPDNGGGFRHGISCITVQILSNRSIPLDMTSESQLNLERVFRGRSTFA